MSARRWIGPSRLTFSDLTASRCEVAWCRTSVDLQWNAVVCAHDVVVCERCHPRDACMECEEDL